MNRDDPRRYPDLNTAALKTAVESLNNRIVQLQKAKLRDKLPVLQSNLHAMKMELKRRENEEKRTRANV